MAEFPPPVENQGGGDEAPLQGEVLSKGDVRYYAYELGYIAKKESSYQRQSAADRLDQSAARIEQSLDAATTNLDTAAETINATQRKYDRRIAIIGLAAALILESASATEMASTDYLHGVLYGGVGLAFGSIGVSKLKKLKRNR